MSKVELEKVKEIAYLVLAILIFIALAIPVLSFLSSRFNEIDWNKTANIEKLVDIAQEIERSYHK